MGKTPFIGLLGLLMAGLALTGCQTSTPRARPWQEGPPPGMIGKGPTPAEKKATEVVTEKEKDGGKPAPDFTSKSGRPLDPPLREEASRPPAPSPMTTEAKSFTPPPDPTPAPKFGSPGREADGLPVAAPRRTVEPPGLDVPAPPVTMPGRSFSTPSGDRPMPLPTDTTSSPPELPPVATTPPPAPPVPPGTSPPPSGPPGLGPPPGTTLPPLN